MNIEEIFRNITWSKTIKEEMLEDIESYLINDWISIYWIAKKYYTTRNIKEIRYKLGALKRKHNEIKQGIDDLIDLMIYQ